MAIQVAELLNSLDQIAPFALAESWDNVGLLIGNPKRTTRSILLGLDPTLSLLKEAVNCGADTLITHHPCIFRPLPFIHTSSPNGAFLEMALAEKINIIACHTNLDNAATGVSDALAMSLGLQDLRPLHQKTFQELKGVGSGRIGMYATAISFEEFVQTMLVALDLEYVQIAGRHPERVQTVAVCGGSGSDLTEEAFTQDADVYLSAEIKHSTARWVEAVGFCVVDGSHYATERPALLLLKKQLESKATAAGWKLKIAQSKTEQPVFVQSCKNQLKVA